MAAKRIKLSDIGVKITEEDFFKKDCVSLAKALLGCILVNRTEEGLCSGKIVETEAYLGGPDKGAHSYEGKRTPKNESMYLAPGTSYVYHVYGRYCCYNISSEGEGAAVLVRALEPVSGTELMTQRRAKNKRGGGKQGSIKEGELGNGPSKLTQALAITRDAVDGVLVTTSDSIWVEKRKLRSNRVPESGLTMRGLSGQ